MDDPNLRCDELEQRLARLEAVLWRYAADIAGGIPPGTAAMLLADGSAQMADQIDEAHHLANTTRAGDDPPPVAGEQERHLTGDEPHYIARARDAAGPIAYPSIVRLPDRLARICCNYLQWMSEPFELSADEAEYLTPGDIRMLIGEQPVLVVTPQQRVDRMYLLPDHLAFLDLTVRSRLHSPRLSIDGHVDGASHADLLAIGNALSAAGEPE